MMTIDALLNLDVSLFRGINDGLATTFLDGPMLLASSPTPWAVLACVVFAVALAKKSSRLIAICILLGLTLAASDYLCFHLFKPLVARPRPCYGLQGVRLVAASCGGDLGFPSNHAANGMAIAVMMALLTRSAWSFALLGVALIVGFSRIYLGVHYPLDVVGAYAIGAASAALLYWLAFRRFYRRIASRESVHA